MQPNRAEVSPSASEPAPPRGDVPRWTPRRIGIVAALWLIGAVVLAGLSMQAHRYPEFPGDVGIAQAIQQVRLPAVVQLVNFASDANWPQPAGIIAIATIALLALFRHFRAALGAAVAGFGADGANVLMNGWVARPRPNNASIHTVAHLGLHSFPSGHVTHVTAFYGFLLYLSIGALRRYPQWRLALRAVQVVCLYFLVFIGPSRVLEGEHWPSDVLASYLLGGLVLVVAITVYHAAGALAARIRHERAAPNVHPA